MQTVFVDEAGGGLAVMAASVAKQYGMNAIAWCGQPGEPRPEVELVLREIGAEPERLTSGPNPSGRMVSVGSNDSAAIRGRLYEGPTDTEFGPTTLERLALARIVRDRSERWVLAELGLPQVAFAPRGV